MYTKRKKWIELSDSSNHNLNGSNSSIGISNKISENEEYSEHQLSIPELLRKFGYIHVNILDDDGCKGLTSEIAEDLIQCHGRNVLSPPVKLPTYVIFLMQFTNLFMVLLIFAGILSIIAWLFEEPPRDPLDLYLGLFLFIVVICNCYSTFTQEMKSEKLMEQFRALLPLTSVVIRDGVYKTISSQELVIGDYISLRAGDKVPADCRIIKNDQCKIDQSMITGESEPIETSIESLHSNVLESRNVLFNGSLITEGSCMCIVIRTGDHTMLGRIIQMSEDGTNINDKGTLAKEIDEFVWFVVKIALIMASCIFVIGVVRELPLYETIIDGFIVTVIANVPIGLPATVTTSMLIVAERMKMQNVFVKRLNSIETLGSCSVICTDKTGTLTENNMSVCHVFTSVGKCNNNVNNNINATSTMSKQTYRHVLINHINYVNSSTGANATSAHQLMSSLALLCQVAILNSTIVVTNKINNDGHITHTSEIGNPTELALYRYFKQIMSNLYNKIDIENYRMMSPKIWEITFNSSNKWQMTLHHRNDKLFCNPTACNKTEVMHGKDAVMCLKGAPDVILRMCQFYVTQNGETREIDSDFEKEIAEILNKFGSQVSVNYTFCLVILRNNLSIILLNESVGRARTRICSEIC
jgi:sodium/potassium-transporting ATPase subunit alpha